LVHFGDNFSVLDLPLCWAKKDCKIAFLPCVAVILHFGTFFDKGGHNME
jgi:hypothetical protein